MFRLSIRGPMQRFSLLLLSIVFLPVFLDLPVPIGYLRLRRWHDVSQSSFGHLKYPLSIVARQHLLPSLPDLGSLLEPELVKAV